MEHLSPRWVLPPWFFILVYGSFLVPLEFPNRWIEFYWSFDTMWCTPHYLKDLNVSPKMKTMEKKRVGASFLAHSTLRVEGCVRAPKWGLDELWTNQLFTWTCTNQTTSWLVHNWSIFGAQTNHKHTQIHKVHHGPDLGEPTTFPLIVFSVLKHGVAPKCHFVSKSPKLRFSQFWKPIIFHVDLRLGWGLKRSCNLRRNLCSMSFSCK